MGRKKTGRPTDTELEIMRIIWANGRQSVRQVHQKIKATKNVAYSTVLTQMLFMYKKGLLLRDETYHSHIYRAARSRSQTERSLVRSLIRHSFGGSIVALIEHSLEALGASKAEVDYYVELVKKLEQKK